MKFYLKLCLASFLITLLALTGGYLIGHDIGKRDGSVEVCAMGRKVERPVPVAQELSPMLIRAVAPYASGARLYPVHNVRLPPVRRRK